MTDSVIVTCIECPRGCRITVTKKDGGYHVEGNRCRRGEEYAVREAECPLRTLTTTVRTTFPDLPRLPVRTSAEVPLEDIFRFMKGINRFTLKDRVPPGAELDCGLPGGMTLIVTGDPRPEAGDPLHWEGGLEG